MPSNHTIHRHHHHFGWDNAERPGPDGRARRHGRVRDRRLLGRPALARPRRSPTWRRSTSRKVNPVTGPVCVDGAEPGDALKVTHPVASTPSGWGWTANIPGFGLLADQFPEPALHIWQYDPASLAPALLTARAGACRSSRSPARSALAPAEPGLHSIVPPRRCRRQHGHPRPRRRDRALPAGRGRRARCSRVGDTHAAQGDGEVCGTAIESPMSVALRFDLVKGANLRDPRFTTPGPVDAATRRRGLRGDDRDRARPDAGGAGRGRAA